MKEKRLIISSKTQTEIMCSEICSIGLDDFDSARDALTYSLDALHGRGQYEFEPLLPADEQKIKQFLESA